MDTGSIIVIAGPTASGKTEMAIKLAEKHGGEVVCADSRTIYKGMDIGTAKPTRSQLKSVAHHGLDLIEPDQQYSASKFKDYALAKIDEIHSRDKSVFITGGSGLYIDALVYNFEFAPSGAPRDPQNPRHVAKGHSKGRQAMPGNILYLAIEVERDVIKSRIDTRIDEMFEQGFVDEVKDLVKKYSSSAPGLDAPGYKAVIQYLAGEIGLDQAKTKFKQADKQLAKRQMTWLRRNTDINWVHNFEQADKLVSRFVP